MRLFKRVIAILVSPKKEWKNIHTEFSSPARLFCTYLLPLVLVACLVRYLLLNFRIGGWAPLWMWVTPTLDQLIQVILSIFICALVTDGLSRPFSSERSLRKSIQLVVYAATPIYLSYLLEVLPIIRVPGDFVCYAYSIYLLYTGLPVLKQTPDAKLAGYLVSIVLLMVVINWLLAVLVGLLFIV